MPSCAMCPGWQVLGLRAELAKNLTCEWGEGGMGKQSLELGKTAAPYSSLS